MLARPSWGILTMKTTFQPRGRMTIVLPTVAVFSHASSTPVQIDFKPIDGTLTNVVRAIIGATGGARVADLRSITLLDMAEPDHHIWKRAINMIASARGSELRAVFPYHLDAILEFVGWQHDHSPTDAQMAAMIHHYRGCMADRGEPVGEVVRAFDADKFSSGEFAELSKLVTGV